MDGIRRALTTCSAVAFTGVSCAIATPDASAAVPKCFGQVATIVGTAKADVVEGKFGNDVINAKGGNDVVHGNGGNDLICGAGGNDRLQGGGGNDMFDGAAGLDTIDYGNAEAAVSVSLAATQSQVTGGAGSDTLAAVENIAGSPFGDTLQGSASTNTLSGGEGSDFLIGMAGNDQLLGGAGPFDIVLFATSPGPISADLQAGSATGEGTDTLAEVEGLVGSLFADTLRGDAHYNLLFGLDGNDVIDGRGDPDLVGFVNASGPVSVQLANGTSSGPGEGTDSLSNVEQIAGSDYADTLTGDSFGNLILGGGGSDQIGGGGADDELSGGDGKDKLDGGDGKDILYGDPGNDRMQGGAGPYDLVSYARVPGPVSASLTTGNATGAGSDTLSGVESLQGSAGGDTLTGNTGVNLLGGLEGDDSLSGLAGGDILDGGPGSDILNGGTETDTCANGETLTACEIDPGDPTGAEPATPVPALDALATLEQKLVPRSSALPPDTAPPPGSAAAIGSRPTMDADSFRALDWTDHNASLGQVQCHWLVPPSASEYYIDVMPPRIPQRVSDALGETEWFIPRLFYYDFGAQAWLPATGITPGGWGLWFYTWTNGGTALLTYLSGGPWIDLATFTSHSSQQFKVPNGFYFQVAGWIEWHNPDGSLEAQAPFVWMNWVYGADPGGPWCFG